MSQITWYLLSLAAGTVVAANRIIAVQPWWGLVWAPLFLSLTAAAFWRGKRQTPLLLLATFFLTGLAWGTLSGQPMPGELKPYLGHYLQVTGVVSGSPQRYQNRTVYQITARQLRLGRERLQYNGQLQVVDYRVTVAANSNLLLPGTRVTLAGRLDQPPAANNPGEFDYRQWLARKGIYAQLTLSGAPRTNGPASGYRYLLPRFFAGVRQQVEESIDRSVSGEDAAFLQGFLLGAKEGLTAEDLELYQRTGVMHLFAVSGLNMGFVLLFLLWLARCCRLRRRPTFLLAAAGLWGYAALVSFSPSVTRAAVMGSVGLVAHLWQRRQRPLHSLIMALAVVLLADPQAALDPGLQLTFAATWGIVLLAGPLGEHLPGPAWLRETLAVTLAAQMAVMPLIAGYFLQLPLLSLLSNLLVVPISGAVVLTGLAGMILTLVLPGWGTPFYWAAAAAALLIRGILHFMAALPGSSLTVAPPPGWLCLLWYLLLLALGLCLRQDFQVRFPHFHYRAGSRKLAATLLLVLGLSGLLLALGWKQPGGQGLLRVTWINVGQGDSMLVQFPNGRNMLVDAGGQAAGSTSSFDPGQRIVLPYLLRNGIDTLDLLLNTHPHEDHLGGVPAVLKGLEVRQLVVSPANHPSPIWLQVEQIAAAQGITVTTVTRGGEIRLDPQVSMQVLNPPLQLYSGTHSDLNNDSLVLKLTYGKVTFLLSGDIEAEAMEDLSHTYPGQTLQATVFKIPHHGSRYGLVPAFASLVRPSLAVISVGRNSFGHPAPETLAFWGQRQVQILRTDRDGTVTVATDGRGLSVTTGKANE